MQEEAIDDGDGDEGGDRATFRIYRADATKPVVPASERGAVRKDYVEHPGVTEGLKRFRGPGTGQGAAARILFSSPWAHVAYAWFKSGFPLPLHSHDADCFYQIIAGSMQIGTEELHKGDGMLVPAGVPYTVTPGAEGVEFLEIRPTGDYDTRYRGKTERYWDRIVDTLTERQTDWATEPPPYGLLPLHTS